MRSYVAVIGSGVEPRQVAMMAERLRLPGSSRAQIEIAESAVLAAVDHRSVALPIVRDASTIVAGDVRLDDRETVERTLGVTTADDLRLVLHAWERWGAQLAGHISGDYSVVIWDERSRRLHCIRDRFGVRPLFYAHAGARLIVSDVLESVLAHPEVDARTLNLRSVATYLAVGMVEDPAATMFAAVHRVRPGHVLTRDADGSVTTRRYWVPLPAPPLHDPVAQLEEALGAAVRDRTRGESSVVFMSGGLDSTTLAALASEARPGSVTAVTSIYRARIADEEESYASEAARSLGIPIALFPLDSFDALAVIGSGMWSADPGPLLYAPATRAVYAAASSIAPRALHGHPADALFLGDSLAELGAMLRAGRLADLGRALFEITRARRRPPWFVLRSMLGLAKKPIATSQLVPDWFGESLKNQRNDTPVNGETSSDSRPLRALDSPIWANYFEWAHPLATRAPIELEYPFCDARVVEVALAVGEIPWRVEKHILRELLRGRISERIRKRRKSWLQGDPWQAPSAQTLELPIEISAGLIDAARLRSAIASEGVAHDATLRALVFEYWLRELPERVGVLRMA